MSVSSGPALSAFHVVGAVLAFQIHLRLWTKESNPSIIKNWVFVMIMLLIAALLGLAAPVSAQSTLQLPDLTLFGEYTLYLAPPEPPAQAIPSAERLMHDRLSYPRSVLVVSLAAPPPPVSYWQRIPRSVLAPPGVLYEAPGEPSPQAGVGQSSSPNAWLSSVDYVPGSTLASRIYASRSSGAWDLAGSLRFNLADGWITAPPSLPTGLTLRLQARRLADALGIDGAFGLGAFYNADPAADAAAVYTLGLAAALHGEAGVLHWREGTGLFGISGVGSPSDPDVQRGAVQQDLELSLVGSRWDLSLRSAGLLAAGLPSSTLKPQGRVSLELGWRQSRSIVRMWAGGAALYAEDSPIFYPSGGLELFPNDFLAFSFQAAPFLRLPSPGWQTLSAVQTVSEDSDIPHLRGEWGYSLRSELRLDPGAVFGTAFSFEWRKGRGYTFGGSEIGLDFGDINLGVLGGELIWQIRPGRPAITLNLTGELAASFPLAAQPWRSLQYGNAGLVWRTDFHKLPVEFIIKALTGDYADDGSEPFLFTDWELFSGSVASIEANWKAGNNGTVHTGFEAFLSPNFSFRFLIGYGIRR
jgi:hypothetical protein